MFFEILTAAVITGVILFGRDISLHTALFIRNFLNDYNESVSQYDGR